jgi:hypothetical protein
MSDNVGFTTTPGLDGALVRAKNQSDPRWGTTGICFGMLGSSYVLVMFDEFPGYVAAVPVAEFAQHYFLRPKCPTRGAMTSTSKPTHLRPVPCPRRSNVTDATGTAKWRRALASAAQQAKTTPRSITLNARSTT